MTPKPTPEANTSPTWTECALVALTSLVLLLTFVAFA